MPQIGAWLARLGLREYVEIFAAQKVDFEALHHLSDDDLKELGLPLGPRRKILATLGKSRLEKSPARPSTFTDSGEPERRQLTVMFVDLVGSTELSQRLDPEDMREVIDAYRRAVSAQIVRYEGYVAQLLGDGVLAYFGWPSAHEDDAERAIRAGLAAIAALAEGRTQGDDLVAARVGIATGLVVVGDIVGEDAAQKGAVVGEAPNLAARLQVLAEPNSVIIAETTQRLTAGLFETTELRRQQLKGFAGSVAAWRVTGELAVEGRFLARRAAVTPLVGRTAEVCHLLHSWDRAKSGQGQVVLISGEPGIGKSHLIAATEERLRDKPRPLHGYCSPHHANSAFHPLIKLIERTANFRREDTNDTKLDKLGSLLCEATCDQPGIGALVAELLSLEGGQRYPPLALSPQARKMRTVGALVDILFGLAARRPVLMVVEDLHWVDPTTKEWLDDLIGRVGTLPILLILSFRPEAKDLWRRPSYMSELSLGRLASDECAQIVEHVSGPKCLPRDLEDQILANSEGVPLFVEELAKAAMESSTLGAAGDDTFSRPALGVPTTLKDSLMARLDRLGSAKELAQIGACIGRSFHYRLVEAVAYDASQLAGLLLRLEKSELVFREGTPPEATYSFKHALIQNAAYESLLRKRRRGIHARIAAHLESDFPDIVAGEPETLAYHHTMAGSSERAVQYWLKAGRAALKRSANREAVAHLKKGIELVASLSSSNEHLELEVQLHASLGIAMMGAKGFGAPDVLVAMSRARALSERLNDNHRLFTALCGEASYQMISGHLREADVLGHQCMALAELDGDEGLLLEAHHRQWATKFFMGDYAAAERHLDFGLATYQPDCHHHLTFTHTGHDPGVCCRSYSAQMLWLRGYPDQAVSRAREAVTLAERVAHPLSIVLAAKNVSEILLWRREPEEALRLIAEWDATSSNLALPLLTTQARFQRGWAHFEEGRAEEGVNEMRNGLAAIRATGAAMGLQYFLCVLAQGYAALGLPGQGMTLLEEALKFAADTGTEYQYPELLRTKGELLLRLDPSGRSAEDWLRLGLTRAQEEGTKMLQLRAAVSLGGFLRDHGKDSQARDELEPVYNWFTEGAATPDLLEAKTLLAELA